jgi:Cys-tRNA(Pro) deacylase
MYSNLKRFLLGRPLATHEEEHQRLPKLIALAVFASDAISSTAYATEEILLVLVPGSRQLDWPKLRAHLGVSRLSLPDADEARDATGYERGTITPLGTSSPLPVVVDTEAAAADLIAIGGGAHGVSLLVAPADLVAAVDAQVVDVTKA